MLESRKYSHWANDTISKTAAVMLGTRFFFPAVFEKKKKKQESFNMFDKNACE